jgi:hypothetical protein
LVSIDDGADAAADERRGALRRAALRRGAARLALRFAGRFALLADRFGVFFFDAFLLVDLRDLAIFFAVLRRFLAMRAPPDEWARVF